MDRSPSVVIQSRYALSHGLALTRYIADGQPEIDNIAKRAVCAVVPRQKIWLFADSDDCGEAATVSTYSSRPPRVTAITRASGWPASWRPSGATATSLTTPHWCPGLWRRNLPQP